MGASTHATMLPQVPYGCTMGEDIFSEWSED